MTRAARVLPHGWRNTASGNKRREGNVGKLTLEITTDPAAAMTRMLDLATRIHLCQFGEIEHMARMGELKHQTGRRLTPEECGQLTYHAASISAVFGFTMNASHGIGARHISKDAHRGYEVMKVMQKALAEHRDPIPHGMPGVDRDGLICRCTDDPEPVAVVKVEGK